MTPGERGEGLPHIGRPVGDRADRADRANGGGAGVCGGLLQLDAGTARMCGLGTDGAYDPGSRHVVPGGELRGQLGGLIRDAVEGPAGEDFHRAASVPGEGGMRVRSG